MKKTLSTPVQEAASAKEKEAGKEQYPLEELKQAQASLATANEKYLRLYSEFENFRKRAAKEKLYLMETAGESILKKLLPITDDFERALEALQATDAVPQVMQEGIRFIYEKLTYLLQQEGVQSMPLEKGTVFDTELHEAVTQIPAADKAMQGKVLDVLEKGYLLKEKVLRFAKVVTGA
jgi:molecular chaperone GrpE